MSVVPSLTPELVWGVVPRCVGFLYVLAFSPLFFQHHVMIGARRLAPVAKMLERTRRDFPGLRRFFDQPTLLWLHSGDATLRALPIVGTLCGLCAMYGGPPSFVALLVAWLLWLSLEPRSLVFPWDTMLVEVGFLVLFLPAPHALPRLDAGALPLPSVAFMMRFLVLRLMLGFAKEKFIGTEKRDALYLRGFFVWMPLPNPLGWLLHHAPAWFLKSSLYFMFFAEAVAPWLGLFAGPARLVSCAALVMLMVGIQLTGNWGYFNLGYALLCLCLLDTQSSLLDLFREPWSQQATSWPDLAVHITMGLLFLVSLFYLAFTNSWITRSWINISVDMFPVSPEQRRPLQRVARALAPLRALAPFRIVNGYGVFPPHSAAPMRMTPVLEGSTDGVTWKQYGYRFMPSFAHSRPPIISPNHARMDQWSYYVTMGMESGSLFGSVAPNVNPYYVGSRFSLFDLLMQRILAHDPTVLRQLGHNPFPDQPPNQMRVGYLALTPTRPDELRETGAWWHVRRIGTLLPARGVERDSERLFFPEPELFHPDLVQWKRRARPIRAIERAFAAGASANLAVLAESDLTALDVQTFWDEFVPMLGEARADWSRIHERAAAVQARFGVEGLYRQERVLERFAWLLRGRTFAHRFDEAPLLPKMTNYTYHMLLHELIGDGPEAYERALAEPRRLVERFEASTQASQLWILGQLRYQQLMAHARIFRVIDMGLRGVPDLPGFLAYYDFVAKLVPPDEEFVFQQVRHDDGEITVPGFYPPPRHERLSQATE